DYQADPKHEDEPGLHVALFVMTARTVSARWRLSHARLLPVNVGRAGAGGVAFAVATQRRRPTARQYQEAPRRPTSGGRARRDGRLASRARTDRPGAYR